MDDTRDTVLRIVSECSAVPREDLRDSTRIVQDLNLDGDDVEEILERVAATFAIDMSMYRWDRHHGPEGCNPLWLIFRPVWLREPLIPIRIADIIEAATTRRWPIRYD